MKKNFKMAVAAMIVAVAGIVTFVSKTSEEQMSDIALANVDALATDESFNGIKYYEHHCGTSVGTQCIISSLTGPECYAFRVCP